MSQPEINLGRFVANAAFTDTPFRFVKLSSGKLVLCGAGEAGLGVIQDEPLANEAGNVMLLGVSKVLAGGTITQGQAVKSDATGKAVAATASDAFTFGIALEGGSSGEYIDVYVAPRGAQPNYVLTAYNPPLGTDVEATVALFRAPYNCTVSAVSYTPNANITGAATNHRKLELINKGADGNGADVVASITFDNGIDALDFDEEALTLSGTPANLDVDAGEILALASTAPGTGIADPGGLVSVTIVPR